MAADKPVDVVGITDEIAGFVVATKFADIPQDVESARKAWIDNSR